MSEQIPPNDRQNMTLRLALMLEECQTITDREKSKSIDLEKQFSMERKR